MRRSHPTVLLLGLVLVPAAPLLAATVNATLGIDTSRLAGADSEGRVLLFTPDPLESGSSVSHWDTSAFPNLLMEPSISPDLVFQRVDLTLFQLRDLGWRAGSSTMTLRITDPPGQGFNDPDLGPQRLAAMRRVAAVWASRVPSSVEINVAIGFDSLECGADGGVLAQAGAEFLFESFPGAPFSRTWYHGALAEALSGQNLSLDDVPSDPDAGDLALTFNEDIDTGCLGSGSFYYGLDGNVGSGQLSFIAVALHEMAHGLGFSTFTNDFGGFFMNLPDIYSRFILDTTQGRTWNRMSAAQRRDSAVNTSRVVWNGNQVTRQSANFLESGPALLVNAPASIAGTYQVGVAQFGPELTAAGITGDLVLAVDASAEPSLLCGPVANAAEVAGKVAVVDRGTCLFVEKVQSAQDAGAIGVVVVNNVGGPPPNMAGDDASIVIPSVSVSIEDGDLIKAALEGDLMNLVVEPQQQSFPDQVVGGVSAPQLFMILNTGTQDVFLEIALRGVDRSDYRLPSGGDRCSGTILEPNETCRFRVRFAPRGSGLKRAMAVVSASGPGEEEIRIPLRGTGISAAASPGFRR